MNATEVEFQRNPDGIHRILVLAHEGLGGDRLVELLDQHEPDQGSEVFLLVPALSGSLKQLANDDQDEIAAAQSDLQRLLSEVGSPLRRVAGGLVGDSDPKLALEDVLRQFAADEVIVVNPPESEMSNSEESSTTRALADVSLPVTVLHVPSC